MQEGDDSIKMLKLSKMTVLIGINIAVSTLLVFMCKDQSNLTVVTVCGILFRICNIVLMIQVAVLMIHVIKRIIQNRK